MQVSAARERIDNSDLMPGVSLTDISVSDTGMDLGTGERVIVIMTPTCSRCRRAIPKLNRLTEDENAPEIVGLTHYDQGSKELVEMKETLKPLFPILTLTKKDFMRLAWGHGVPRVALLRDGEVVRVWEAHDFPNIQDLASIAGQNSENQR